MKANDHHHHMYELCEAHMHAYVLVETVEGHQVDGIVTGIDDENVYLAVPNTDRASQTPDMYREDRQFGYGFGGSYGGYPGYGPGYGGSYGGYPGYGPGYGYGPGGYHGGYHPNQGRDPFKRLILPLTALTALSVLPWY